MPIIGNAIYQMLLLTVIIIKLKLIQITVMLMTFKMEVIIKYIQEMVFLIIIETLVIALEEIL